MKKPWKNHEKNHEKNMKKTMKKTMKTTMKTTMGTQCKQPFKNHTNNHGNSIQTTRKQHYQSFTWTAMNKKHGVHLHFAFSGIAVTPHRHQHTPKLKFVVNVDIVGWFFIIPHYNRAIGSCIMQCAPNVHHVACNGKFGVLMCSTQVCVIYVLFCD